MSYVAMAEALAQQAAERGSVIADAACRAACAGLDATVVAQLAAAATGLGAEPAELGRRAPAFPDDQWFLTVVADIAADLVPLERLVVSTGQDAQRALRAAQIASAAAMAGRPPDMAAASAAASAAADAQVGLSILSDTWGQLQTASGLLDGVPRVYEAAYEGALRVARSGVALPRDGRFLAPERPRAAS